MKTFIFAAGLGTRLRPLTDNLPKALVSIGGKPMLKIVTDKLHRYGFDEYVVNVHHHADILKSYIARNLPHTDISDESDLLRDTGGGIRHARRFLEGGGPFLAHNVDILTDADLSLFTGQWRPDALAMLLTSDRATGRRLLFDRDMRLVGWENSVTGEIRSPYPGLDPDGCRRLAFSGIHMISDKVFGLMEDMGEVFPVIDFYLKVCKDHPVYGICSDGLRTLDAGKPETLKQAGDCFRAGDRFWE